MRRRFFDLLFGLAIVRAAFADDAKRQPKMFVSGPVTTYTVTNPALFPAISLTPKTLIFVNGKFSSPGFDYTLNATSTSAVLSNLSPGDTVSVVDLS